MHRPTFADPKTDFAFKRIFGSEEHKDVLIAFLNHMLDLDGPHRIVTVELLPPEQRPAVAELKLSIVDVKCTDSRGVTYVVEMQVLQVEGFEKRVVYNVAKAYVYAATSAMAEWPAPRSTVRLDQARRARENTHQIARGELYPDLNDVVGITICDFELWPDNGERQIPMLSRWRMTEQHTGSKELGQIRLVFLELPKYDAGRPPETLVEKWAYFFREADNLSVIPEPLAEHPFMDALEAARTAGFTAAEWEAYILAGIALQNERGALSIAERRGRDEGLKDGLERGLKDGLERGLKDGLEKGEVAGLVAGIEALCSVLDIELNEERRRALGAMNVAELAGLLSRLRSSRTWE